MLAEILQKVASAEYQKRKTAFQRRPSLLSPEIPELNYKGKCKRAMWFHAKGIEEDNILDRMALVFDDSLWHQELTSDWINKTAFKLRDQDFQVQIPALGKGHIDGILTDPLGTDYLYEHKAWNHFSFHRLISGEELPIDALAQCAAYLRGLQDYLRLDRGILLVKNKNTAQYCEFSWSYSIEDDELKILSRIDSIDQSPIELNIIIPAIFMRGITKFEEVERWLEKNMLPPRDYFLGDWRCDYCGWRRTCWESYEEEFKDLRKDIELSSELDDTIGYHQELGGQLSELKKEREKLSQILKEKLRELGAKRILTPEWEFGFQLVKRKVLNEEKIPQEIREAALEEKLVERLQVKRRK